MTLKDGYWFGGVSRAPPSKQHLSTPPPPGVSLLISLQLLQCRLWLTRLYNNTCHGMAMGMACLNSNQSWFELAQLSQLRARHWIHELPQPTAQHTTIAIRGTGLCCGNKKYEHAPTYLTIASFRANNMTNILRLPVKTPSFSRRELQYLINYTGGSMTKS